MVVYAKEQEPYDYYHSYDYYEQATHPDESSSQDLFQEYQSQSYYPQPQVKVSKSGLNKDSSPFVTAKPKTKLSLKSLKAPAFQLSKPEDKGAGRERSKLSLATAKPFMPKTSTVKTHSLEGAELQGFDSKAPSPSSK